MSGEVIESNGAILPVPVPVVGGLVDLGVGVHTVLWTATDENGNAVSVYQNVTVAGGVMADGELDLRDRSKVLTQAGVAASIMNLGTTKTTVGVEARSGDVRSIAWVDLRDRAVVVGGVWSSGNIARGNQVTVGTTTANTSLSLPDMNVPVGGASPTGSAPTIHVGLGQSAGPLAPGGYASITIKTGGTLTLAPGTFQIGNLDLEPGGTIIVQNPQGTKVGIHGSWIMRGAFKTNTGAVAPVAVDYFGTSYTVLEAPFAGTVRAPTATVVLRPMGASKTIEGQVFARNLQLDADVNLRCASTSVVQARPE